ncbi:MAG: hypothetical protein IKZ81_04290 [Clostridia bacterium]|nr:hypothetical protein [Clostridia bacterium]
MKKIIAFTCAGLMLLSLFGCGGINAKDLAGSTVTGRVEAIDGSVITLRVAGDKQDGETVKGIPDVQMPPNLGESADIGGNSGTQEGQQPPELPDGQQPPDAVSGATQNGGNGNADGNGNDFPQMPNGQQPPNFNGNGNGNGLPQMPNGQQPPNFNGDGNGFPQMPNGELPELPNGQMPDGQTAPQLPDGVTPPDMQDGNSFDGGSFGGRRDDFSGGKTVTIDLATVSYADGVEAVKAEDIKVGSMLEVTFDSVGNVSSVKIVNAAAGNRDRNREPSGNQPETSSGGSESTEEQE